MVRGVMLSLRQTFRRLRSSVYRFGSKRWCEVCNQRSGRFLPAGIHPRPDAKCAECGSLERHRLAWRFLTTRMSTRGSRFLHVAPEPCIGGRLRELVGTGYLSGDLTGRDAMVKLDITNLAQPDGSYDLIYCSHVLEHVPDDRKALREFYRVLAPGGTALIQVPLASETTEEDFSVVNPSDRQRLYGHPGHVRNCGRRDYSQRFVEAGFALEILAPADLCKPADLKLLGLSGAADELLFVCRKK